MAEDPIPMSGRDATKLRERLGQGLTILTDLLGQGEHRDLGERVAAYTNPVVLMTRAPETVLPLLRAAWELRNQPRLDQLFKREEGGSEVVSSPDQPIAPCNRTFKEVVTFALRATAEAYFERSESDWSIEQAERARQRWKDSKLAESNGLLYRLTRLFSKEAEPVFDPAEYRQRAPMKGLFPSLEPYLVSSEQFGLLRSYCRWSVPKVEALGTLVHSFRDPDMISFIGGLGETDLSFLRGCARSCVEAMNARPTPKKGVKLPPYRPKSPEQMDREEAAMFADLLTNHLNLVPELLAMGRNADSSLRLFAPLYGTETWNVMQDPSSADNVVNVPEEIQPVLGSLCRYVPPKLSRLWAQVNDVEIMKDILLFCRDEFPENEMAFYLSDASRYPVWASLPRLFNNQFAYQRDAAPSKAVKNKDDLRAVTSGIFDALKTGKVM